MGPSKKIKSAGTPRSTSSRKVIKPLAPAQKQAGISYHKPQLPKEYKPVLRDMTPPTAQPEADAAPNATFINRPLHPLSSSPFDGPVMSPDEANSFLLDNNAYGFYCAVSSDMMAPLTPAPNLEPLHSWNMPRHVLQQTSPFDMHPDSLWQPAVKDPNSDDMDNQFSWLMNDSQNYPPAQVCSPAFNDVKQAQQLLFTPTSSRQALMNPAPESTVTMDDLYSRIDSITCSSNVPPLTFDHSSPEDNTDQAELFSTYAVATNGEEQPGSVSCADEELVGVGLYEDRKPSNRKPSPRDSHYQFEKSEETVAERRGLVLEETWQPPVNQFFGPSYNGEFCIPYPAGFTQGSMEHHDPLVPKNTNQLDFNPQVTANNGDDTQELYGVYNGFTEQDFLPMHTFPDLSMEEEDITAFFGGEHVLNNGWPVNPTATGPLY